MSSTRSDILSRISICILTHNRVDQLVKTLDNLKRELEGKTITVVVLNNGSSDSTASALTIIAKDWPSLIVVQSEVNIGCAKGREEAWKLTNTEYILSLDDDILLKSGDILKLIHYMEKNVNHAIVSPVIVDYHSRRVINPLTEKSEISKNFYEACFLLRSSVLSGVGFFDPILAIAGEGLDYSIRLNKAGYSIRRAPDVVVEHVDRIRPEIDLAGRRKKWLWSFCYLYFKNFGVLRATILSLRVFIAHIRTGWPLYGFSFVVSLPSEAISGARFGLRNRVE